MITEVFNSTIKGIHLALEVKTFFDNSTPVTGSSMKSNSQSLNFLLMAINDIAKRGRERSPTHNSYKKSLSDYAYQD
jgi:hypothetical protein